MNKKIIILIAMITVLLTGCSNTNNNSKSEDTLTNNDRFYIESNETYGSILVDNDTCVEYLIRYKGGVTVIYNSDSSVKINEECASKYK